MDWVYLPAQVATLARFAACNPWNGGQPARFRIDASQGGLAPSRAAYEGSVPLRYALIGEDDGSAHPLPDALVALWQSGKLGAERLPAALQRLEPTLGRSDFMAHWSLTAFQRGFRKWVGLVVGAVVLSLTIALSVAAEIDASDTAIGAITALLIGGGPLLVIAHLERRREQQAAAVS